MACPEGRGRAGFDQGSSSASEQTSHCQSVFEPVSKGGQSAVAEPCVYHQPHVADVGKSVVREVSGTGRDTKSLMQGMGETLELGGLGLNSYKLLDFFGPQYSLLFCPRMMFWVNFENFLSHPMAEILPGWYIPSGFLSVLSSLFLWSDSLRICVKGFLGPSQWPSPLSITA